MRPCVPAILISYTKVEIPSSERVWQRKRQEEQLPTRCDGDTERVRVRVRGQELTTRTTGEVDRFNTCKYPVSQRRPVLIMGIGSSSRPLATLHQVARSDLLGGWSPCGGSCDGRPGETWRCNSYKDGQRPAPELSVCRIADCGGAADGR